MVREWWFIRHGYTAWNRSRRYLGHRDVELLSGAEAGLARLPAVLAGIEFSRVYCSDLLRCRETLARIRPDLVPEAYYDARIRELNFGEWEGLTYEELKGLKTYRNWIDDPASSKPPGGESWRQFEARVEAFLHDLSDNLVDSSHNTGEGGAYFLAPALIVTHGGVISLLAGKLAGIAEFHHPDFKLAPGEVLRMRGVPGDAEIVLPPG